MSLQETLRIVLVCSSVLLINQTGAADIIASYTVTESGHVLEGATVTSTAQGDFEWTSPAGFPTSSQYAALNSSWVTTISGAVGAGAAWNSTYMFEPTSFYPNVGLRFVSTGQVNVVSGLTNSGGSIVSRWTNGTNSFTYQLKSLGNGTPPVDGSPVELSLYTFVLENLQSRGGTAPTFFTPTSGGIVVASSSVPEPSSLSLLGLVALGLLRGRIWRTFTSLPSIA